MKLSAILFDRFYPFKDVIAEEHRL